jgi:hypothetical protein
MKLLLDVCICPGMAIELAEHGDHGVKVVANIMDLEL